MQLGFYVLIVCCSLIKFNWAVETVDVYNRFTKYGNECSQYGFCGALGRHPCSVEKNECGPCINGFIEMSHVSRICRRIKPSERRDDGSDSIVDFALEKRASYLENDGHALMLTSSGDRAVKAAANRHTITFLILIAMAVAGVILVGILGIAYHKYSKSELKAKPNSNRSTNSNRKLSYGFEGLNDNDDKELARKTQIYHYQHQKRMISSMEHRQGAGGADVDSEENAFNDDKVVEEASLLIDKQPLDVVGSTSNKVGMGGSPFAPKVVQGQSRDSLLRMRSQGSIGTGPSDVRSVNAGGGVNGGKNVFALNQHQSIDRILSNKKQGNKRSNGPVDDSEEEVDPDYTVYECPGLAPSGEMEVKNPLFPNEDNMTTDEE